MLTDVRVKDSLNDEATSLLLQGILHVLHNVALGEVIHYVEGSCQVVVLKHACVRVTDREWMLRPHDELI